MGQMYFPGEDQKGNEEYEIAWGRVLFTIVVAALVGYGIYWLVTSCSSAHEDEIAVEEVVSEEPEEDVAEEEIIEEVEEAIPSFNFEAFRYYRSSEDAEIELKADFPTGESIVADSIRQYIHEIFGGQYRCSYEDAQDILNYYGDKEFRDYEKEHQEIVENIECNDDDENEETYTVSAYKSWTYFKVDCIEDRFVTYKVESYFWTGGIHELGGEYGVTFNRTTGKRINYSYFANLESSSFKKRIKEGLKRYFQNNDWSASDDEELKECLLNVENVNDIPLPNAEPYFTPKGVCFKYCSYEIASYAAGFPSFVLPYDEARPYMTEEALDLIGDTETIVAE